MDYRLVVPLADLDNEMALVHPKTYLLRGLEILQRCFGCERQQSDRGLEEDDSGFGPPHRSP